MEKLQQSHLQKICLEPRADGSRRPAGQTQKNYPLKNKDWNKINFALKSIERHGAEIILESEEFWIPAEIFSGSDDRRELPVMVKDAKVQI